MIAMLLLVDSANVIQYGGVVYGYDHIFHLEPFRMQDCFWSCLLSCLIILVILKYTTAIKYKYKYKYKYTAAIKYKYTAAIKSSA